VAGSTRALAAAGLLAGALLLVALRPGEVPLPPAPSADGGVAGGDVAYAKLPLAFEPNASRMPAGVDFVARGSAGPAYVTQSGARLVLADGRRTRSVALQLLGSAPAEALALDRLPGTVNDLRGDRPAAWERGIPTFERVRYPQVYPGVDLDWHGSRQALEYDFRLAAGADPGRISIRIAGARDLRVARNGDLVVAVGETSIRQQAPVAYQPGPAGAGRDGVPARFRVRGETVSFALGTYDRSRPLVIDPVVLDYSTYLGGNGADDANGIAVDETGAAYVTGRTLSADFDTAGPVEGDSGRSDAFITKLDPEGDAVVYSTYLGGNDDDRGSGIAVHDDGAAYVIGSTQSTDFNTVNEVMVDPHGNRNGDAFIAKLEPGGDALAYSTYLGSFAGGVEEGFGADTEGVAIAVDAAGAAYVTGNTNGSEFGASPWPLVNQIEGDSNESTPNAHGTTTLQADQITDAFIAKLAPAGGSLEYSTLLGGNRDDGGTGIAVDDDGSAYVSGATSSSDFDTVNPIEGDSPGYDAFVSKLSPEGSSLEFSTYLGGGDRDAAHAIALDADDRAYVTGSTSSTDFDVESSFEGDSPGPDAFVSRLSASGDSLEYSTYLGGSEAETGNGIAVDDDAAFVTGATDSKDFDKAGQLEGDSGESDAFVSSLDADGGLSCSTYLGGGAADAGRAIASGPDGAAHVAGTTESGNFDTAGGLEGDSGAADGFVSKLDLGGPCESSPDGPGTAPNKGLRAYVIVLDGLRPREVSPILTPNLNTLRQQGTWYEQARSVFVAETLPNHAAMMTGVLPARNGIVANDYWQPAPFTISKFRLSDPRILDTETLTTSLEKRCDVSTATIQSKEYLWRLLSGEPPDTSDPSHARQADYHWDPRSSRAYIIKPDEHTPDARVMEEGVYPWLRSDQPTPQFAFINLGDIDRTGHVDESAAASMGEVSGFRQAALTDTDKLIGDFVKELKDTGKWDESVLIFTSDHGMDWGLASNSMNSASVAGPAEAIVPGGGSEIIYYPDGTDLAPRAAAIQALPGVDFVATREPVAGFPTIAEMGMDHPTNGDIVAFAAPGFHGAEPIPGNHGHPITQHSTLFVGGGHPAVDQVPQSVAGETVYDPATKQFSPPEEGPGNLSIAPTVARLFGLPEPPGGYDGEPLTEAFDEWALAPHSACGHAVAPPQVSVDDVSVAEGSSGTTDAGFKITLDGPSTDAVRVSYSTSDGTAAAPGDYESQGPTTVTFDPGQTEKTVNVAVKGDAVDEPDEQFTLELTPVENADLADVSGTGTIVDDEPTPQLSIDDVGVAEGDTGTTMATFSVSLSGASQSSVSVDYVTTDGTAQPPDDYSSVGPATLTFAPLETTPRTISVPVAGDTLDESNEAFTVDLSAPQNAVIAKGSGTGTILDDDGPLDSDGDLVSDGDDGCPGEAGPPANDGCPIPQSTDADGDGVSDAADQCATQAGPASNDGCPLPLAPRGSDTTCDNRVVGTAGNDFLNGSEGGDLFFGVLGSDRLLGLAGPDCLFGGPGNDLLNAASGNDVVRGGDGRDRALGGPGNDAISGGRGNDKLSGGGGDDRIRAFDLGRDRIKCGPGQDEVVANEADTVSASCEEVGRPG
jgi:hypothetical protein